MFLYINIELVNEQAVEKCLILNYQETSKISFCLYTIGKKM